LCPVSLLARPRGIPGPALCFHRDAAVLLLDGDDLDHAEHHVGGVHRIGQEAKHRVGPWLEVDFDQVELAAGEGQGASPPGSGPSRMAD
jgi:hypothetical protein